LWAGLAVNAHGYLRLTKDADLAIDLVAENILRAFQALSTLGYSPRVPITATQFADPALRATWIREKEMKVLQFFSDQHRETPVDVFVIEPFDSHRNMRGLSRLWWILQGRTPPWHAMSRLPPSSA